MSFSIIQAAKRCYITVRASTSTVEFDRNVHVIAELQRIGCVIRQRKTLLLDGGFKFILTSTQSKESLTKFVDHTIEMHREAELAHLLRCNDLQGTKYEHFN